LGKVAASVSKERERGNKEFRKWLTGSGQRLVKQLTEAIEQVEHNIAPHRKTVLTSQFGPALRKHVKELQQARQTYGPARLSKA
jgi:phenylpropionate dioxygenase-like ring-hydroxylating dioxygenase large terminal subunit